MSGAQSPPPLPAPSVSGGTPPLSPAKKVAIVLGGLLMFIFLFWMGSGSHEREQTVPAGGGGGGPAGVERRIALPPAEVVQPVAMPNAALPLRDEEPRERVRQAPPRQRPRPSAIMAFEEREEGRAATAAAAQAEADEAEDGMAARLRATRTPAARARRLKNPDLMIALGDVIPCTRDTAINTQLGGFVRCTVSQDVLSASGNTTLLPRRTVLTGEIKGQMQQGQNRAFILWSRARTPDGVVVDLASPGTDALGRNGTAVEVNTNFWARFGGAIMLSFVDAGLQAGALAASNATESSGGTRINFNQLQGGGRSAATRALDASVNIPPFGTSPQGAAEMVFVARDLDFSGVYELRAAR